jgi:hypothetical protein
MIITILLVILAILVLIGAVGAGVWVLIKLGVIASYAVKDEPEDRSTYGLDQSRPADNE